MRFRKICPTSKSLLRFDLKTAYLAGNFFFIVICRLQRYPQTVDPGSREASESLLQKGCNYRARKGGDEPEPQELAETGGTLVNLARNTSGAEAQIP
jgi:hypothetical protein